MKKKSRKKGRKSPFSAYKRMNNPVKAKTAAKSKSRKGRARKGPKVVLKGQHAARKWSSTKKAKRASKSKSWKAASTTVRKTWRKGSQIKRSTTLYLPNPIANSVPQLVALGVSTALGAVVSQNIDGMIAVRGTAAHPASFTGMEGSMLVAAKPDAMRLLAQAALFGITAVGAGYAKKKDMPNAAAVLGGLALGTVVNNVLDLFHKLVVPALPASMTVAYPGMTSASQDMIDKSAEQLRSGTPAVSATAGARRQLAGAPNDVRVVRQPAVLPAQQTVSPAVKNPFTAPAQN